MSRYMRPASLRSPNWAETGGLSGRPLRPLADRVIARIYRQTQGKIAIIAAGGVFTGCEGRWRVAGDRIYAAVTLPA